MPLVPEHITECYGGKSGPSRTIASTPLQCFSKRGKTCIRRNRQHALLCGQWQVRAATALRGCSFFWQSRFALLDFTFA